MTDGQDVSQGIAGSRRDGHDDLVDGQILSQLNDVIAIPQDRDPVILVMADQRIVIDDADGNAERLSRLQLNDDLCTRLTCAHNHHPYGLAALLPLADLSDLTAGVVEPVEESDGEDGRCQQEPINDVKGQGVVPLHDLQGQHREEQLNHGTGHDHQIL